MIIFVRSKIDWLNFDYNCKFGVGPQIQLWNEVFQMKYHEYRHRLQQIAQESIWATGLDITTDINEAIKIKLVIPIDDDDWLSPQIDGLPEKELTTEIGLTWNVQFFSDETLRFDTRFWCCTNSYAVHTAYPHQNMYKCIYDHTVANEVFKATNPRRLACTFGCTNRNLGSATVLKTINTKEDLLNKLNRYKEQCKRQGSIFDDYFLKMGKIYEELNPQPAAA